MNTRDQPIEHCFVGSDDEAKKYFVKFLEPQPFSYILSIMRLGRKTQTLYSYLREIFFHASVVVEISEVDHYGKPEDQKFWFTSPGP